MSITAAAPVNLARVRQNSNLMLITYREANLMTQLHLCKKYGKIYPLHTTCSANKTSIDDLIGNTNGFENLCTFVRLQSGDAHFGHYF